MSSIKSCSTPKKKKQRRGEDEEKPKHRSQKYRKDWELDNKFKSWLKPVANDQYKARCTVCDTSMIAEYSVIQNHSKGKKHKNLLEDVNPNKTRKLSSFFGPERAETNTITQVKEAEIKLCAFLAEHNISFLVMDHLDGLLKSMFPDSEIAKQIQLKRTKATCIVKNVIGESHKQELITQLRKNKFSVLYDDSTDIGCVKTGCVVARIYSDDYGKVRSIFWELLKVLDPRNEETNEGATAENIYNAIMKTFSDHNIPTENIIGFASDGCNTMMGDNNSVASRFRIECPGIIIMKCICHCLHLCASAACKELPRRREDLARNVYNYMKSSCKRQCKLAQFQMFMEVDVHKLLHPSQTRWLSLLVVVERILEQWEALKLYFDAEWIEDRLVAAEEIHKSLNGPFMRMYYFFLRWILPKFVILNKYFQYDSVIITRLHEMCETYKEILLVYMKQDYVMKTSLQQICPNKEDKFLNTNQMYLGVDVIDMLNKPEVIARPHLVEDFMDRCRSFLKVGRLELKKRYDFDNKLLPLISILKPSTAMSLKAREQYPLLMPLIQQLPRIFPKDCRQQQNLEVSGDVFLFQIYPKIFETKLPSLVSE